MSTRPLDFSWKNFCLKHCQDNAKFPGVLPTHLPNLKYIKILLFKIQKTVLNLMYTYSKALDLQ